MKLYMCIREKSRNQIHKIKKELVQCHHAKSSQRFIFSDAAWPLLGSEDRNCLLYTSDAADDANVV